jgi:type II secretory pathway pseudopilin PulG
MINRATTGRIRGYVSREDGMTLIEVMVAALILILGSLAVLGLVTSQAHNTYRAEQSQVVSNRLQQEMEKIKRLPFSEVALTGIPADTSDTTDPRWRVTSTNYATSQDGSNVRPLVYNGGSLVGGGSVTGGTLSAAPEDFTSGDVHGKIYRSVVWEDDPQCPAVNCPGAQDMKRVMVAIRLDTTTVGGARHYQELQTQIFDPDAVHNCLPGSTGCATTCTGGSDCIDDDGDDGNDPVCIPPANGSGCFDGIGQCNGPDCAGGPTQPPAKPWLFFLTDTPCNNSSRQPITADHKVHNTNGVCSAGMKTSDDCTVVLGLPSCPPGAPDLMYTTAPPLAGESPLYDYATDLEPPVDPGLDKGLQMPKPGTNGCLSSLFQPLTNVAGALIGDPGPTRMQQIHKWVSPLMGTGFNVTISPGGTLNLWTQTINEQSYTGRICIWLFERHLNLFGVPVDTPVVFGSPGVTSFSYQPASGVWPQTWQELHIDLPFTVNLSLTPTSRLGLAIQVEGAGTSGGGLQFMYDEPSFDSRLELKTSTSLLPF